MGQAPKKHKDSWHVLVGSAGDSMVIDEALFDIAVLLREKIDPDIESPSVALDVWRKEIGDLAFSTYKKYKERNVENPSFELLLVAADKHSTILYVTSDGKTQDLPKFGMIGTGRITGGELLLSELLKEDITEEEAAHLAALVVTVVGHVDISVGGKPDIQMARERCAWVHKETAFEKILKTSESRWELLGKVWWKMQEDKAIENKLKELL